MNAMADKFFDSIKGKKVTFIGIGTSNLPLIKLFVEKGAKVTACDKKNFEDLGQNGIKAKEYGAELYSVKIIFPRLMPISFSEVPVHLFTRMSLLHFVTRVLFLHPKWKFSSTFARAGLLL